MHLAGVSGGEKIYSGSSIIIKIYPALSLAIGGRDGVDGGGGHWMTSSRRVLIIEHVINHGSLGASSLLGSFGGGFRWGKIIFRVYYNCKNLSCPFCCHWGAGWDGLQQALLDDVFYLWNTSSITVLGARSRRWGHWAIFFIGIYTCMSSYNINIPILPFTMPQGRREWVDGRG